MARYMTGEEIVETFEDESYKEAKSKINPEKKGNRY
jgi:hypothetical protein